MSERIVRPQDFTADMYAPLAHIIGDGSASSTIGPGLVPSWADAVDQRRLLAYRALSAIASNMRRYWLRPEMWQSQPIVSADGSVRDAGKSPAESFREYGDPSMLVDTARALVLGDDQTIVVPAAAPLPELEEGATPPEGQAASEAAQRQAAAVLSWLEQWAIAVGLQGKMLDSEETTITIGDSAYVLAWSPTAGRPRLKVYDGGYMFPDWASIDSADYLAWGWDDDDFPPIMHAAWELPDPDGKRTWVRRHTWTLVPVGDPDPVTGTRPTIDYPWGPGSWRCLYRVDEWRTDGLPADATIYTMSERTASHRPVLAEVDLGIDFIPVIMVPNDVPGGRRFGRSLFSRVAQLLDDVAGVDTDLSVNGELVASSPVVTTGISGVELEGGPGARWEMPTGATAGLIDTSKSLDALLKLGTAMLERLAVNIRFGQALLGRIKPNDVPSGYALRLGFAPAEQLMREMRLVRDVKFPLLLKFAVRLAQAGGVLPAGPTPVLQMHLGNALPADRAATITEVKDLLTAHAISSHTAVAMLQAVGLPVEDIELELGRIRAEMTEAANQLVEATGNTLDAYEFMGIEPATDPTLPAPALPPPPA